MDNLQGDCLSSHKIRQARQGRRLTMRTRMTPAPAHLTPLTPNQVRGFLASWAGWALDGMDSFIYALVLVPAMRDLLPRSGGSRSPANVGFYGGLLFAVFLVGWGFAFLWGPLADRFGRVRTLMLTILCYSLFTFLGAVAANLWQLAAFRFAAGAGIGGEWTLGGVLVAEEWPEARRRKGAAWMHTGYYFGIFLAALLNWGVGSRYGWRAMFAVGGAPALLVAFIRYGVREPGRWQTAKRWSARQAFAALFSDEYRQRTIVNAALVLVSMVGLWAGSVYVPSSVGTWLSARVIRRASAARLASCGTMLLSVGTVLGCLMLPRLAERMGRRGALGVLLRADVRLHLHRVRIRVLCAAWRGSWSAFSFWGWAARILRSIRCGCRSSIAPNAARSAFAFATSFGRFLAAGATFLVGAGVARMQTIGTPVALTSMAFAAGLLVLRLAYETRGKELPE